MEETNNTNNKSKVYWIVIVLVVLVVGVLSFYFRDLPFFNKIDSSDSAQYIPTVEKTKLSLENNVPFSIPDLKSSIEASLTDLDKDLSMFIAYEADFVQLKKDLYSDGSKGWFITYEMNKDILDSYRIMLSLAKSNPFVVEAAQRANLASIITTKSTKYNVKILTEKVSETSTKVTINIQEKIN